MQAAEKTVIKSEREYLKSCFYNALANGSLGVKSMIAHDFGVKTKEFLKIKKVYVIDFRTFLVKISLEGSSND